MMKPSRPHVLILFTFFALLVQPLTAQPRRELVEVLVAPERAGWIYEPGEPVRFAIAIHRNGRPVEGVEIAYTIGPEQMPPVRRGTMVLSEGEATLEGGTLEVPGFLRCRVEVTVDGKTYADWGTAGFSPDAIEPVVGNPADFDVFWDEARAELADVPLDAVATLMPEACTAEVTVYHVSLQNVRMPQAWRGNSRFYGVLSVPAKPGNYPAILVVPGAGVRAYGRDDRAARGAVVFQVGIHGIPVNQEDAVYQSLATGALAGYPTVGLHDRDAYYFKRVYLGCVRAIDYLHTRPEFDGERLVVTGGSQGGALSIITAALDPRVDGLAAFYPALCDLTAYLEGQAGGWPHMFKHYDAALNPGWKETAPYFDVVNFARRLRVPGWYSWGFNDHVCPPTSMHAAFNSIPAQKSLQLYQETEHWTFPEQRQRANDWLFSLLERL